MSFDQKEKSRYKGRPNNLFLIRHGVDANSYFAYTDHTQDLTVDGITYQSVAITRGAIVIKGNMDKSTLEIRASRSLPISSLFLVYPPPNVISLSIYQVHLSDENRQAMCIWTGRITSASFDSGEVILSGEPIRTTLRRLGLRRNYQYTCPHVLFGDRCKANKAAATIQRNAASVGTNRIDLASGWNPNPLIDYVGGMVEWTNGYGETEVRSIISATATRIVLSGIVRDLEPGQSVAIIRGCNRTMSGCNSHNNILNFGGCPFIPTENPVSLSNRFY